MKNKHNIECPIPLKDWAYLSEWCTIDLDGNVYFGIGEKPTWNDDEKFWDYTQLTTILKTGNALSCGGKECIWSRNELLYSQDSIQCPINLGILDHEYRCVTMDVSGAVFAHEDEPVHYPVNQNGEGVWMPVSGKKYLFIGKFNIVPMQKSYQCIWKKHNHD